MSGGRRSARGVDNFLYAMMQSYTSQNVMYILGTRPSRGHRHRNNGPCSQVPPTSKVRHRIHSCEIPSRMTRKCSACAAGSAFVVVKKDGSLWVRGKAHLPTLMPGADDRKLTQVTLPFSGSVDSVAASDHHLFCISDGKLFGCGLNDNGQLGKGTWGCENQLIEIRLPLSSQITDVATSDDCTLIVTKCGKLFGMGKNCMLGLHPTDDRSFTPTLIMEDVESVSLGQEHALVVKKSHQLFAIGNYGQTGDDGSGLSQLTHVPVKDASAEVGQFF